MALIGRNYWKWLGYWVFPCYLSGFPLAHMNMFGRTQSQHLSNHLNTWIQRMRQNYIANWTHVHRLDLNIKARPWKGLSIVSLARHSKVSSCRAGLGPLDTAKRIRHSSTSGMRFAWDAVAWPCRCPEVSETLSICSSGSHAPQHSIVIHNGFVHVCRICMEGWLQIIAHPNWRFPWMGVPQNWCL